MREINIEEPYWSAWKEFGWQKGTWGIGLQRKYLEEDGFLRIYSEYHDTYYLVDIAEARKVAKIGKNKPKGVILFVIPMGVLRPEVQNATSEMVGKGLQTEEVKETGEKVS